MLTFSACKIPNSGNKFHEIKLEPADVKGDNLFNRFKNGQVD